MIDLSIPEAEMTKTLATNIISKGWVVNLFIKGTFTYHSYEDMIGKMQ